MGGDNRDSISIHTKAFLTKVHKLKIDYKNPRHCMCVGYKGKLLTLLIILDAIEQVGVAQSVWEDGEMGESFIPNLTKKIHHMNPNFVRNAMKLYCNNQAIVSLVKESIQNLNNTKKKSFEHYQNLENI